MQKKPFRLNGPTITTIPCEYNSLKDPNLGHFFSSPQRKKLLLKQNLVKII